MAPHPTPDGQPPALNVALSIYGVGRTTKYPEEAFKFLKWFAYDRQAYWGAKSGYGPVTKAGAETPDVKNDKYLPVFTEEAKSAVLPSYLSNQKEWPKVIDAYNPEFQLALSGSKSVKDATNAAATKIKTILGDAAVLKYPAG